MAKVYENTTNYNVGTEEWCKKNSTIHSDEYKAYLAALCDLASNYISEIRVQFATKAYEKYQDPTVRRLVLAYGEEVRKLREDRLRDFAWVENHSFVGADHLHDSCLNNARHYAEAIHLLFDINLSRSNDDE